MKMALGKGLDVLLPEKGEEVIYIDIEKIVPGAYQPRKMFKDDAIKDLAVSIKEKGVLQPLIVSRNGDGSFSIIAGERRWRAAHVAGLKKIPALIKNVSSQDAIEIALIENIQREELNPLETAEAFQRLLKEFSITQEELSQKVGKDRATIANYLRILKLPDEIKTLINSESISVGHAKALLVLESKQAQIAAARDIIKKGLNVRAAETLCKKLSQGRPAQIKKQEKMPEIADLENKLIQSLGTKVKIHHKGKKGKIEIEYYSLDEFDRLFETLMQS